ncbi:TetR/AcrR family transcriptional regulator [Agrococcus sp. ARC_14]|uniref:TetR/AcrR family transcriptional regulator n=1 Tax=Agrococcus sp. ARC_14 TaxID=2919927 RepID=UPI001F059FEE|nr:TetR/AcrR family transcriptional regulator [Agrococcus sp. ARC_14]MCH1882307.1 TetR/AcrR family transcriptional regulator [Agrococcus sp. ARC_14]
MPSRDDWIQAGLRALADGGEQTIRVDPLAAALGVTKGSFHHHFRGAGALREAVLEAHERSQAELVEAVTAEVDGLEASDAIARLGALVARVPDDGLERAVRAWAATDEAAASVQARIDGGRLAALEALWRRAVPAADARTAALVPLLVLIGASASTVASRADLESVLSMLAGLAQHVPAAVAER